MNALVFLSFLTDWYGSELSVCLSVARYPDSGIEAVWKACQTSRRVCTSVSLSKTSHLEDAFQASARVHEEHYWPDHRTSHRDICHTHLRSHHLTVSRCQAREWLGPGHFFQRHLCSNDLLLPSAKANSIQTDLVSSISNAWIPSLNRHTARGIVWTEKRNELTRHLSNVMARLWTSCLYFVVLHNHLMFRLCQWLDLLNLPSHQKYLEVQLCLVLRHNQFLVLLRQAEL